jgi:hypothetical protein
MQDLDAQHFHFRWGYAAAVFGVVALAIAMLTVFGGPFSPQPTVGQTIGEIAGDMRASALRALRGEEQPPPVPQSWDIDRVLMVTAPLLAVGAIALSVVSAIRREGLKLASYGAILGTAAIVFQFVWWLAMLICGVLLLMSIMENIGDILGDWGLGG